MKSRKEQQLVSPEKQNQTKHMLVCIYTHTHQLRPNSEVKFKIWHDFKQLKGSKIKELI
jgi:hypothetical protein